MIAKTYKDSDEVIGYIDNRILEDEPLRKFIDIGLMTELEAKDMERRAEVQARLDIIMEEMEK